jgi:4-hydroxy-3-methylbut-2-enyl diphosphate reductase
LRRAGLTVHHGPVVSTPCVVDAPADRRSLALTGALAVDTESALLAATAPPGQAAVVRAIVDTPDHRLLRAGTVVRGPQALRSLRRAAPVIDAWAAATADREVILAGPRSFCAGAERALALHGPPVYVRRQIVHRQQAIRAVARRSDLVLVLGSQNSSNSCRLTEVAAAEDVEVHLVDDASAVDLRWLSRARRIGITAGASAPPQLVDDLVRCLSGLGRISLTETSVIDEDIRFTLPREVS